MMLSQTQRVDDIKDDPSSASGTATRVTPRGSQAVIVKDGQPVMEIVEDNGPAHETGQDESEVATHLQTDEKIPRSDRLHKESANFLNAKTPSSISIIEDSEISKVSDFTDRHRCFRCGIFMLLVLFFGGVTALILVVLQPEYNSLLWYLLFIPGLNALLIICIGRYLLSAILYPY